jgi:hypothetical protein
MTSNNANIKAIRCDLYVNGTYSTTLDAVQQLGSTSIFNVDVQKIIQSTLVHEIRTNITTFAVTNAVTSAATIKIRAFEIILSGGVYVITWAADGLGTTYTESSNVKVVNMAIQSDETLANYTVDTSAKLLLTSRGQTNTKIPKGVPFQIGFIGSDVNYYAYINELDENSNNLTSYTSTTLAALSHGKGIIEIPSSCFANEFCKYIDIVLLKVSAGSRSIQYRFEVVDYAKELPIFIQNHLGDFDHYNFGAKESTENDTQNQKIKKSTGEITVHSEVNAKTKIYTAALSQADLTFLTEFIKNHSVVYRWISAGNFKRITITSHSTKTDDTDGLVNSLALTFANSVQHKVQKGD